jgi:hypothetical protein
MSEQEGVIRVNISVPKALKARMEKAGRRRNWSSVAVKGFERELRQIEAEKQEGEEMEDIIRRLKTADELDRNETTQDGRLYGEAWAKRNARPQQLRLLAKLDTPEAGYTAENWIDRRSGGVAFDLCKAMHPRVEVDRGEVENFWERVLGEGGADQIEDADFAKGFVRGALDFWEKVKGKL